MTLLLLTCATYARASCMEADEGVCGFLGAQQLLEGEDISMTGRQVDVRDIATAHVRAAEVCGSPQRPLCVTDRIRS